MLHTLISHRIVLLEMYILPVLGSGTDADNGMAHLSGNIHSFITSNHAPVVVVSDYMHAMA
jgi:hypothetical protein